MALALAAFAGIGAPIASAAPPTVTIEAPAVKFTSAHVAGSVDPQGQPTTYRFQYITDEAFQVHGDAQQAIHVSASAGSYVLSFQGSSTSPIAFDASAAEVQAALNALTTIGGAGGSVTVSGGPGDESDSNPYLIVFGGSLGETNVETLGIDSSGIENGGSAFTETIQAGRSEGFEGAESRLEETTETAGPVAGDLTELQHATTYHLRLQAENADGTSNAVAADTFTTATVTPPVVAIADVDTGSVTPTSAHFAGSVEVANADPAFDASCRFEYASQKAFEEAGNAFPDGSPSIDCSPNPAKGPGTVAVSADPANLQPNLTYHLRLVADNIAGGDSEEAASTFTTPPAKATLKTFAAGPIQSEQAWLNGIVNPHFTPTTYWFEWGTEDCETSSCQETTHLLAGADELQRLTLDASAGQLTLTFKGQSTPDLAFNATPAQVQAALEALSTIGAGNVSLDGIPGYYRVTFTGALASTDVEALIAADGTIPLTRKEGTESGSANVATIVEGGYRNAAKHVSHLLTGLDPETTYHFRLLAENAAGTVEGTDVQFTTAAPEPGCANQGMPGTDRLPNCRAWEQVSPVDKNGGDVMAYSPRSRASAGGDLVSYSSLTGFADVRGTGVPAEYLAQRGAGAWSTHAITPQVDNNTLKSAGAGLDIFYNTFSPDFNQAILISPNPVTDDPSVNGVTNIYRRNDLRTPGTGEYELLSECPRCVETDTALPPTSEVAAGATFQAPSLVGASPDMGHGAFESIYRLTPDTPAQPSLCDPDVRQSFPPPSPYFCRPHLFEWDHGEVRLAGILPDESAADASVGGTGARLEVATPHTVSDGSDGHTRIFFTQPADANETTVDQFDPNTFDGQFGQFNLLVLTQALSGNLFMRLDGSDTFKLNASERDVADTYAPAQYLDASADGTRVFFMTKQALTNDADPSGVKIYMSDASLPDSSDHNLTLLTPDDEPNDGAEARGLVGVSEDGHYAYMVVHGQLVSGGPLNQSRVFLWHDGEVTDISQSGGPFPELLEGGPSSYKNYLRQARVTPDGHHLLLTTTEAISSYDQGSCQTNSGSECREAFVFDADTNELSCASCNPSGAAATAMASVATEGPKGAAKVTGNENRGISDDGRYVFFSTAEALVPEDTNGNKSDAYVYDTSAKQASLLSSGTSPQDSWFLDASASGRDAFIVTQEQLVGWDKDRAYDLYDARVGGGFPEPVPVPAPCSGDSCRGAASAAPAVAPIASGAEGQGNPKPRCAKGKVKKHGKCVKKATHKKGHKRHANSNRGAGK